MKPSAKILSLLSLIFLSCNPPVKKQAGADSPPIPTEEKIIIIPQGQTIQTRFNTPPGFERTKVDANSFAYYFVTCP